MLADALVLGAAGYSDLSNVIDQRIEVFCWDGSRITVGTVYVTLAQPAPVLDLVLDDLTVVRLTADHKVVLRDGSFRRVRELVPGDSLMPCYQRQAESGARTYMEPGGWFHGTKVPADSCAWRSVPRMVAEAKLGRRLVSGEIVRLRDGNLQNCSVGNIEVAPPSQKPRYEPWVREMHAAKAFLGNHPIKGSPRNHKVLEVRGGCIAQGSRIYAIDRSVIKPLPIEKLAFDNTGVQVLGYDETKKIIRHVSVSNAMLTKPATPVMRVPLSSGVVLLLTPDHKVLTPDKGYVAVRSLQIGDRLISMPAGFELRQQSMLTHNDPGTVWVTGVPAPHSVSVRAFDVTTETGNLIVDGAVVHNSTPPTEKCYSLSSAELGTVAVGGIFIATNE